MDEALLVFAKVPRPGDVKTRLSPVLTPEESARLYAAFLEDALRQYRSLPVDVRLYLSPPLPDAQMDGVPDEIPIFEQTGDTLGDRMRNAFAASLDDYERCCVIGTDHPTLPTAYIRKAFDVLERDRSLCIGPSEDGGYYLLGMSAFYPEVFADMTYSHSQVFADTLARVDRTDAHLTVLPRWYDVDTPRALARLIGDLEDATVDVPATRQAVAELDLRALVE